MLHEKPDGATHWSVRSAAAQTGISKSSVARYLSLFAALNTATGEVIAQCKPRHRHQEFLAFLRHVDQAVPANLDVHLIVDNYATHKHPKVWAWLARHTRYHMHFTPTYSSWLNQVERWFGLITQQAIRRGSFKNVRQLITSERYIEQYNQHGRPFVWTATADSIPESGSAMQNYFWDRTLDPDIDLPKIWADEAAEFRTGVEMKFPRFKVSTDQLKSVQGRGDPSRLPFDTSCE